ncbi:hypothetical protein GR160_16465 [Flavobacterium sp. Sd200]|uniref:hypothetical protein n=1 Tax=Flavobacterium sp. Sd200 TaxID=2692211 RepID=UPI00136D7583|nr:hypothetical protein [Flavobacterium sp. Sd200]MXN92822.1 hypothetical protein [Flavobacterium sp. Sd200]
MKRTLLLLLLSAASSISNLSMAQISVGRSRTGRQEDFREGQIDIIKSKTSFFVNEGFTIEELESVLKEVWTVNPYKVITNEELKKNEQLYYTEGNAIAKMTMIMTMKPSSTGVGSTSGSTYVYFNYFYPDGIKENEGELSYKHNEVASVYMGSSGETMWRIYKNKKIGNLREDFFNYKLGYFKNYLQYINNLLLNNGTSWAYDSDYNKNKLKELATKTLYISDYLNTASLIGSLRNKSGNPDKLLKKYPYRYEWISDEALNKKILEGGNEDFYYLFYTRVNSQKMITVTNGRTGDVIYKNYTTMTYEIKPKDLGELADAIEKSSK